MRTEQWQKNAQRARTTPNHPKLPRGEGNYQGRCHADRLHRKRENNKKRRCEKDACAIDTPKAGDSEELLHRLSRWHALVKRGETDKANFAACEDGNNFKACQKDWPRDWNWRHFGDRPL